MNDSSTSQDTGSTVADAADRIASLLGPADSETDETQEGQELSDADEDDAEQSDEPSEGDESDEQEQPEDPEEQPALVTVKVNGEEVQVTLDEALKGYSREQDYTRKTQALAEQKSAWERETAEARNEYLAGLQTVQQIIERSQPKVDQSLRDTNPAEWAAQMLQHRQWAEQRQAVGAEAERLKAEQAQTEAAEHQAYVREERAKLFEKVPEWADAKVFEADAAKLISHGEAYGFTADELGDVADHRAMLILRDAMKYRELIAKSGSVRPAIEAKKVAKPGAASAPVSKVQDLKRATNRLRQSGRVDDAAEAILQRMKG